MEILNKLFSGGKPKEESSNHGLPLLVLSY